MNPTTEQAGTRTARGLALELEVRALRSPQDFAECVRLQRETWGGSYNDTVPASLLKVNLLVGGVSAGAFAPDGRMVGFVYGLPGLRKGQLIHWSHMLAVHPDCRDRGVGRRLKEYQRQALRGTGVEMVYWTFDPLVARNAHLNLNRLQVQVCQYVRDIYRDTGSGLHAFGTDRFIVRWPVVSPAAIENPARPLEEVRSAPVVNAPCEAGNEGPQPADLEARHVRVEVPVDIEALAAVSLAEARAWRSATRSAFLSWLAAGFGVAGFYRDEDQRCFYVLSRDATPAESDW